jgi:titin
LTAGSRTTLTGTGFAANTPVTIGIYSTPQVLTTTLSDSSGAISAEVTIPTGYTGAHGLVALGLGPDQNTLRALTLRITIADTPTSPTSPTGGGLAVTGPALTATIGLALALLVVGAAAVIAVRRRRPRLTTGTTDGIDLD